MLVPTAHHAARTMSQRSRILEILPNKPAPASGAASLLVRSESDGWPVACLAASRDRHAPIGNDDLAGDEARSRRGKERSDAADLVGFADPPQRRARQSALQQHFVLQQRASEVGVDEARCDTVDAHVLWSPLNGELAGQGKIRRFGYGVAAQSLRAAQACDRRYDRHAAAAALRHARDD